MSMVKISDEKLNAIKSRAKATAGKIFHGGKGTAIVAGAGAGMGVLVEAVSGIEMLKGRFRRGAALVAGGHFAKRKQHDIGTAMIAVGGLLIYVDYTGKGIKAIKADGTVSTEGLEDEPAANDAGAVHRHAHRRRHSLWEQYGAGGGRTVHAASGMDGEFE